MSRRISRATASVRSMSPLSGSGHAAIGMRGLARKFWMITSCTCPYCSCSRLIASSDSTRSSIVSPMPIRIPVVNGTPSLPASSIVFSRSAGTLSGALPRRMRRRQLRARALQHQAQAGIAHPQPFDPVGAQQAGIGMRQQARFAQHQLAHRLQIMQRAAIAQPPQASRASRETAPRADRPAKTAPRYSPAFRPPARPTELRRASWYARPARRDRGGRCNSRSSRGRDWSAE